MSQLPGRIRDHKRGEQQGEPHESRGHQGPRRHPRREVESVCFKPEGIRRPEPTGPGETNLGGNSIGFKNLRQKLGPKLGPILRP